MMADHSLDQTIDQTWEIIEQLCHICPRIHTWYVDRPTIDLNLKVTSLYIEIYNILSESPNRAYQSNSGLFICSGTTVLILHSSCIRVIDGSKIQYGITCASLYTIRKSDRDIIDETIVNYIHKLYNRFIVCVTLY